MQQQNQYQSAQPSHLAEPAQPPARSHPLAAALQHTTLLVLLLTAGGLLLRLYKLMAHDYWHDEVITTFLVRLPAAEIFAAIIINDSHPPLYHILLHYWAALFGDDLLVLRLFSVLISTACVPLTYLLGRTLAGRTVGLGAAGVMALSPFHIYHAQQARMYPLLACLVLVATLLFLRAWRRGRWYDWLLLGVSIAAGFYTHVFFFFSVPALLLWVGIAAYQQGSLTRWRLVGLLAAPLLAAIAFVPFLPRMLQLTRSIAGGFWIGSTSLFDWMYTLVSLSNHATLAHDPRLSTPTWYLVLTFVPAVAAVLLTLLYSVREARRHPEERPAWLLLHLLIWVPIAIATMLSITIQPILLDRALIGIAAPLYVLMAWMGVRFGKHRPVQVVAGCLLASIVASLAYTYPDAPKQNEMIRIAHYLAEEHQPGDAIAYTDWQSFDAWVLSYPQHPDTYILPGPLAERWKARVAVMRWPYPQHVQPVEEFAPGYKRVWLVQTTYGDVPYHTEVSRGWLEAHGRQVDAVYFQRATLFLYEVTSISPTTTSPSP